MASEDRQMVDDCGTTHLKQTLPQAPIPGTAAWPAPHMRQGVRHGHPLPQLRPSSWALLPLPQFPEQLLIGRNRDAAPLGTPGAPPRQGTGGTDRCREVDHAPRLERDRHFMGTADGASLPIQGKGGLWKASAM